jgi:hypothetical protein
VSPTPGSSNGRYPPALTIAAPLGHVEPATELRFFGAGNAGPCLATTMTTAECGQGSSWTPWHRYKDLCLLRLVEGGCKLAASTVSSAELQVHSCQCRPQVQSHKCKATSATFSLFVWPLEKSISHCCKHKDGECKGALITGLRH